MTSLIMNWFLVTLYLTTAPVSRPPLSSATTWVMSRSRQLSSPDSLVTATRSRGHTGVNIQPPAYPGLRGPWP